MIKPKNILIVRTDRIGDVVLSLPLASFIKKNYPNCKITFLVRDYTKALIFNHPHIDNVLILYEQNGKINLFKNAEFIKKNNFDVSIVVYPTFRIALLLFLSRIKIRIGSGYRWYSFFFNKRIFEHRKYGEQHELEYNLNMLKLLGISENVNKDRVPFNIHISKESEQNVLTLLVNNGYNEDFPTVIIHPGSSGSAIDLPKSKFKDLIKLLAQELRLNIVITGANSEVNICEELSINNRTINFAGYLKLDELIALINKSDILIANSTGPIHIAAALGKHVIGFYPKIKACSPTRWGPFTDKKSIFTPTIDCDNCTRKQCEELNCMNSINVIDVQEETRRILNIINNKSK